MRLTLATLLFGFTASAQSFEHVVAVRVDDAPMSARATAMGGASDALSTDASDLAANPALLASLKRAAFSVSGAQSTFDITRYDIVGNDVVEWVAGQSQRALTHVGAAVPLRGFVLGLYARNEPRIVRRPVDGGVVSDADYEPVVCSGDDCVYVLAGAGAWDRRDRRYGVTAAFERGSLSFGAGAELQDLDETYDVFRAPIRTTTSRLERVLRRTSGREIVPNAGVRWRVGPRVAVAAAYNGAATFERTDDICANAGPPAYECTSRIENLGAGTMRGADAYRATVTVMPVQRLVLSAEAVRRNFSNIDEAAVVTVIVPVRYRDTTDLRAGAEYRLRGLPVSLRAGWQRQPGKLGDAPTIEHRTYGAGIDVRGARIDVAYDDADAPSLRRAVVGVTFGGR